MKILLVENHDDTLAYLIQYLEMRGHEVQPAKTMQEALTVLADFPVEVLISDIGLSDGDGWSLLQAARSQSEIPFAIAMSGYGMRADAQKSFDAGYHHHLVKPFLPDDLDQLLAEAEKKTLPAA